MSSTNTNTRTHTHVPYEHNTTTEFVLGARWVSEAEQNALARKRSSSFIKYHCIRPGQRAPKHTVRHSVSFVSTASTPLRGGRYISFTFPTQNTRRFVFISFKVTFSCFPQILRPCRRVSAHASYLHAFPLHFHVSSAVSCYFCIYCVDEK